MNSRKYLAQGPSSLGLGQCLGSVASLQLSHPRELRARWDPRTCQVCFTCSPTMSTVTNLLPLCSRHVYLHLLEVKIQEEKAIVRLQLKL